MPHGWPAVRALCTGRAPAHGGTDSSRRSSEASTLRALLNRRGNWGLESPREMCGKLGDVCPVGPLSPPREQRSEAKLGGWPGVGQPAEGEAQGRSWAHRRPSVTQAEWPS